MKNNARFRAFALIAVGLIGMAAYQIILRTGHPAIMDKDFVHGMWVGVCAGLEIIGLYLLAKNTRRSAA